MAVTNQMLLDELQRLQFRVNELAAGIALLCERAAGLETWRDGHDKNVHTSLREQIKAMANVQVRQGERLWKVALQVAQVATLLAVLAKLTGAW